MLRRPPAQRTLAVALILLFIGVSLLALGHRHTTATTGAIGAECQLCVWAHTRSDAPLCAPLLLALTTIGGRLSVRRPRTRSRVAPSLQLSRAPPAA